MVKNIISKTENKIKKILIETKEEFTCYSITKRVYETEDIKKIRNKKTFIRKYLIDMERREIIIKKKSYPVYYQINSKIAGDLNYNNIRYEVECPKCKRLHRIIKNQITKQCRCLTESGKNTRFFIYDNRLIREIK